MGVNRRAAMLLVRDNVTMRLHVQCYAGRKADERPLRFQLNAHEYVVEEVVDQWYGPEHAFFKLRADDGNLYILRHQTSVPDGEWELVSFRQTEPASPHTVRFSPVQSALFRSVQRLARPRSV